MSVFTLKQEFDWCLGYILVIRPGYYLSVDARLEAGPNYILCLPRFEFYCTIIGIGQSFINNYCVRFGDKLASDRDTLITILGSVI